MIVPEFCVHFQIFRTDNGHEFQANFHWHIEDLGIKHA